ncbi:MAG TPA: non-ribosomal peptide synthetase [Bryobacteraceae bacterium]|nr:non-ribosomal peptide synthetase [Bryobacteraceae bacterium]
MPEYLGRCIHELFEVQAEKIPNACAVQFEGRQLSYGALNASANRVARHLQRCGVGPEMLVGVEMQYSLDSVVALFGILKAGGAYVFLDPSYPKARREALVRDCRPALVLDKLPECPEGDLSSNPVSGVQLDNAAFLIYTSGSTGRPRGVVEIHRSMINRLIAAPLPDIQTGDVCCLNSSLNFGISASRLFMPLALGARVVILPEAEVRDIRRFVSALEAYQITSAFMVPAVLRQILDGGGDIGDRLRSLRAVAISGGSLTPEIAQNFFRFFPGGLLINVYGGTEIGTAAAMRVMTAQTDTKQISIGHPVVNTRIDIVDGEIVVASRHLARGYLNLPSLTSERFGPDPRGSDPSDRVYKTGDLGRVLPNGEIEFLGRADHQIKIRGFRVELGEIEAALHAQGDVLEAVVAPYEVDGDKHLAGYVVLRPSAQSNIRAVRQQLARRLPDHMLPTKLILLRELPRTDNGKIDRNALPTPSPERPDLDTPYEPPHSNLQKIIVNIWEELLHIKPAGIHDHFLELGGDSLLAAEAIARISERAGIRADFTSIFDKPTIAELAEAIEALREQARTNIIESKSARKSC